MGRSIPTDINKSRPIPPFLLVSAKSILLPRTLHSNDSNYGCIIEKYAEAMHCLFKEATIFDIQWQCLHPHSSGRYVGCGQGGFMKIAGGPESLESSLGYSGYVVRQSSTNAFFDTLELYSRDNGLKMEFDLKSVQDT